MLNVASFPFLHSYSALMEFPLGANSTHWKSMGIQHEGIGGDQLFQKYVWREVIVVGFLILLVNQP